MSSTREQRNSRLKFFGIFCALVFGFIVVASIFLTVKQYFTLSVLVASGTFFIVLVPVAILVVWHNPTRCFFFLLIPSVVSNKGRSALVAYAFYVAFSGPVANLMKNVGVLTKCIACSQEQVKSAMHELIKVITEPYATLKEAIKRILPLIERSLKEIKDLLGPLKKCLTSILEAFHNALHWLKQIFSMCNKEQFSPQQKCEKAVRKMLIECREKLGVAAEFCEVTNLVKMFCYGLKSADFLCEFVDMMPDEEILQIIENTKKFANEIEEIFYMKINFHHNFEFQTNSSKSIQMIQSEILQDIHNQTDMIVELFSFIGSFASLLVLSILYKVFRYQRRYITQMHYRNVFITKKFHEIDAKRVEVNLENVLPLTSAERKSFIEISTFVLMRHEYREFFIKSVFLVVSTIHLCGILLADYSLFWLLSIVRHYGNQDSGIESEVELLAIKVTGHGIIAEMCRELVEIFKPLVMHFDVNLHLCLPQPLIPDFGNYRKISILIALCWFLLLAEPFGLRLRSVIMDYHYPEVSDARTDWLYQKVLRTRKNNRRQLGMTKIRKVFDCFWLRRMFSSNKSYVCMLCGGFVASQNELIKCQSPECFGVMCWKCFADANVPCPICKKSLHYADSSDFSEEVDSSEDDEANDMRISSSTNALNARKFVR